MSNALSHPPLLVPPGSHPASRSPPSLDGLTATMACASHQREGPSGNALEGANRAQTVRKFNNLQRPPASRQPSQQHHRRALSSCSPLAKRPAPRLRPCGTHRRDSSLRVGSGRDHSAGQLIGRGLSRPSKDESPKVTIPTRRCVTICQ